MPDVSQLEAIIFQIPAKLDALVDLVIDRGPVCYTAKHASDVYIVEAAPCVRPRTTGIVNLEPAIRRHERGLDGR